MVLADYVNTFGQHMLRRHGQRVHKIALNAGFSCPNRDGSKGIGGCTFCNNQSFNPAVHKPLSISQQIANGQSVIRKRTGATKYLAYFQAYTNTYAEVDRLKQQYEAALKMRGIIGLSIGTRPDCVPDEVIELLSYYRQQGFEVWLELGLQSSHDHTLHKVNRGHSFNDYTDAVKRIRAGNIPLCTHLILGLPGEHYSHMFESLQRVLELGVDGLKLHPLHVVKGTQLARQWLRNEYTPLGMQQYIHSACKLIESTPAEVIYHRVSATAEAGLLLAPHWCAKKWAVLNGIEHTLKQRNSFQGKHVAQIYNQQVINDYGTGMSCGQPACP